MSDSRKQRKRYGVFFSAAAKLPPVEWADVAKALSVGWLEGVDDAF